MELITLLNEFAGLFALLALIATIVIPIVLYKKQKKDERQAMKDELDAMNDMSRFPMDTESRNYYIRKSLLERWSKKYYGRVERV